MNSSVDNELVSDETHESDMERTAHHPNMLYITSTCPPFVIQYCSQKKPVFHNEGALCTVFVIIQEKVNFNAIKFENDNSS